MSLITANSLYQESVGSMKMHIANFVGGATSADTYSSSIPNIVGYWANVTGTLNTATNAGSIECSQTGSTFTFRADSANETLTSFTLYVLSKAF